ncbi:MAG: hypothetical protein M0D57_01485 [Sphingobacteriales bacterium JAD_PAG50586_3]|nr:MAG: hypothetical protein M0D57_01485 [Sphingobacteriales bacterium JAD_PAG50586_3]
MKKIVPILFLVTVLFSATPLHQLLKLPVLVQHFFEHKQTNKELSFTTFISKHYFNGDDKDADYKRDMQLPFKTLDHSVAMVTNALPVVSNKVSFNPEENSFISHILIDETIVSSQYLSTIWQPPKVC